jgi:hypothetical protein
MYTLTARYPPNCQTWADPRTKPSKSCGKTGSSSKYCLVPKTQNVTET